MANEEGGSITRWIDNLKAGDEAAAQVLWERYFARMVDLARVKIRSSKRSGASDEEDAALSAFDSFWDGVGRGRFPQLANRDDLWRLLIVITNRKVLAQARREFRLKRGGGKIQTATDLAGADDPDEAGLLAQVVGTEPTPDSAAATAEEYARLLEALGDETLRNVAVWRMEGFSTDEIALKLGCARRTVARQLALIRTIWQDQADG